MLRFCFPRRFHDRAAPLAHRALRAELPAAEAVDADAAVDMRFALFAFRRGAKLQTPVRSRAKHLCSLHWLMHSTRYCADRVQTCGIVVPKGSRFEKCVFSVIFGAFWYGNVCSCERCFRVEQVFRTGLWSEMWSGENYSRYSLIRAQSFFCNSRPVVPPESSKRLRFSVPMAPQ